MAGVCAGRYLHRQAYPHAEKQGTYIADKAGGDTLFITVRYTPLVLYCDFGDLILLKKHLFLQTLIYNRAPSACLYIQI